jgi:phosphonate transport system substrate-binding protein
MFRNTNPNRKLLATICLSMLAALAFTAGPAQSEPSQKEYVLGVFPHLPPRDIEEIYAPIAKDLGKQVGKDVVLSSNTTFERFAENLDKQVFDIVLVQPFDYVRIADRYGYRPLATREEKLSTVLVVKQESTLKGYADLRRKHLALPDETAAVSLLALAHLRNLKLIPGKDVTVTYHRSHISCMQQVVIGEADACGTAAPSVRFFERKMNVQLKSVDKTREIPHALFAVHPRVPAQDREALRRRILDWGNTEDGRAILARGELRPFVAISDADYNVVRNFTK